ncbi:MAG: preprotein translocase subunit TatB [Desulfobacterales bacterium C00003104]|jgi:TusA-related sulfurtransferase|nr:MAG: preprotein translocase subunit TatB [Desulfobacterales bacterium C00003104]
MDIIVDAAGFSCPQPVLMTLNKIKEIKKGEMTVIVDTETSRENVSRAAVSQGWEVAEIESQGSEYRLVLKKE